MTILHRSFHYIDAARPHARVRWCLCLLMAGVIVELATPVPVAAASPAAAVNTTGVISDFFYHADDLYNVMAITDDTGAVADAGNERYEYADYGRPVDIFTIDKITGTPSAIGNPYLFTGRRYDAETGWYYYRSRFLDPIAGRFVARDTIGIWGDSTNLGNGLAYAGQNPASRTDPNGSITLKYKKGGLGFIGCGQYSHKWQISLDAKPWPCVENYGYIVQKVETSRAELPCKKGGKKQFAITTFYEAWRVSNPRSLSDPIDHFRWITAGGARPQTYGVDFTKGELLFFCGEKTKNLEKDPKWQKQKCQKYIGKTKDLICTDGKPTWWPAGASTKEKKQTHSVIDIWCCCPAEWEEVAIAWTNGKISADFVKGKKK